MDVLALMLTLFEDEGDPIPAASPASAIQVPEGASLVLIEVDTDQYRVSL